MSNPEKNPVFSCLSVHFTLYSPLQPNAVTFSFTDGHTVRTGYSMSLKDARQLEESLFNPTYKESPPFASPSGDMVNIFLDEKTKPTFQMTPKKASDFQKKLFEELSPYYSQLDT
ncbi:MAG: hypothetical protein OXC39_08665 [Candidatus Dadabacteria bacterium]|nr:hypothetical protein [Candidatus Dadabacteria bacterium]